MLGVAFFIAMLSVVILSVVAPLGKMWGRVLSKQMLIDNVAFVEKEG
jgi:hypothetical protein